MYRDDAVLAAIRAKDVETITKLFFVSTWSHLNTSYKTETNLWDYKVTCPSPDAPNIEWAELAKDVLAFHNAGSGGVLIFGVDDNLYDVVGLSLTSKIDSKLFNDKIRKYVGDKIWVEFYLLKSPAQDKMLGFAIIPPLEQAGIKRFLKNGPEKKGRCIFQESGTAIRQHDSSVTLSPRDADDIDAKRLSIMYREYEIDEPHYRLLSRDYNEFIRREFYCNEIVKGLHYNRAATVSLVGIGGIGKTALATWAVKNVYKNEEYDYIVSISAKDRELLPSGIQAVNQELTTMSDLLNAILDVIGFPELKDLPDKDKLSQVLDLIEGEKLLLFVDNLETTSDKGIIDFLNDIPDGVKAIVTSRRNVISRSTYPIEIGTFETKEVCEYLTSLASEPRFSYCKALSQSEKEKIGNVCNNIPLAVKWMVSRSSSPDELLSQIAAMENGGLNNEELLEFSFRRVFEEMSSTERNIMQVLAVVNDLPIEAIIKGGEFKGDHSGIMDALSVLVGDTIIIKYYDEDIRGDKYRLLPLTKRFMLKCLQPHEEKKIQKRLSVWYNAEEIADIKERQIVSAMRQGGTNMGNTLLSFAEAAARKGDYDTAKNFFDTAIKRDPNNWRVYWRYGEYYRHIEQSTTQAITMYEHAKRYSEREKMNIDIAIMNREFGIIYGNSGQPDATDRAIQFLTVAYNNMPNDPISAKFLAAMYERKGDYGSVIDILKNFSDTKDSKIKKTLLPKLLEAYQYQPEKYILEIAELKNKLNKP